MTAVTQALKVMTVMEKHIIANVQSVCLWLWNTH